jgi:hypothetical protein
MGENSNEGWKSRGWRLDVSRGGKDAEVYLYSAEKRAPKFLLEYNYVIIFDYS